MPSVRSISKNLARAQLEFFSRRPGVRGPMESLPGRTSLVCGRACLPFDQRRAPPYRGSQKAPRQAPEASPFPKAVPSPPVPCGGAPHPRKMPVPLDARLIEEKDAMLASTPRSARPDRVFPRRSSEERPAGIPHAPPLPGYPEALCEWFQMIDCHQIRHTKQRKKIARTLPKTVTSLHIM